MRRCTPETTFRPELKGACAIVRELHVYGSVVPVHDRDLFKFQHRGYGVLLMEAAERIALNEYKSEKIAVISGVGTRNYYRKLGYELEGPYMVKSLVKDSYKSALYYYDKKHIIPPSAMLFPTEEEPELLNDAMFLEKWDKSNSYVSQLQI